eukprot:g3193.t1
MEHVCSATKLLEKRRQMFDVQEELEREEELYLKRQEEFVSRENLLRKHDQDLQKKLVDLKNVLSEKEAKIGRATKRYDSELKQRKQKEQAILELKVELKDAEVATEDLKKSYLLSKKYQIYLEKVVECYSEEFTEISEVLSRHRTLKAAHDDLLRRSKSIENSIDQTRAELQYYTKEKTNDILNLNNKISTMRKTIDHIEATRLGMQTRVRSNMRLSRDKKTTLGQIFMAVANLRERCTKKYGKKIMHSHLPGSEEVRNSGGGEATGSTSSALTGSGANSRKDLDKKGKQARDDLLSILGYVRDFETIVRNGPKKDPS